MKCTTDGISKSIDLVYRYRYNIITDIPATIPRIATMIRLRVRELAEARGLTLSTVQREAKLPVSTARRYWWSSRTGLRRDSGTLREVNLLTLQAIADFLGVPPGDLLVTQ